MLTPLLTPELAARIPPMYTSLETRDPLVICRFYLPGVEWFFYVMEWDGTEWCYRYVVGQEIVRGYFSLRWLETLRGPAGIPVRRDPRFTATPLSIVRSWHEGTAPLS